MKVEGIGRIRARNSGLLAPGFASLVEVLRHHGAMQSQDFGRSKWSIGQRVKGADSAELDRLFAAGHILRTHVLRPTWHFVAREDIRWLLALTAPRVQAGNQSRYRGLGLDPATRSKAEKVIVKELSGDTHRTRKELGAALEKSRIDTSGQRLPHLLMHCELESIICSGAPEGKQQTYALLDHRAPKGRPRTREQALTELVRRYLRSHGPATVKDLGWWSSLTLAGIRSGLAALGSKVGSETIDGVTLWWLHPLPSAPRNRSAVHLLQAFDETVVGYTESRYVGDARADAAKKAFKNGAAPPGTLVVDGHLAGHWRRTVKKNEMQVTVYLYEELSEPQRSSLEKETEKLGRYFALSGSVTTSPL